MKGLSHECIITDQPSKYMAKKVMKYFESQTLYFLLKKIFCLKNRCFKINIETIVGCRD